MLMTDGATRTTLRFSEDCDPQWEIKTLQKLLPLPSQRVSFFYYEKKLIHVKLESVLAKEKNKKEKSLKYS